MGDVMKHPYIPEELQLPGYVPIFFTRAYIVGVYAAASSLLVLFTWILSGRCSKITTINRVLMCWWAFTGLTHIILEGYFVFSPDFYKLKSPVYLAEVWKEYSKGDSRYVARDSAVVTVEGITAVLVGPASLLAVYAIGARKPYSHLIQFAASLSQLYGDVVYFVTAYLEGDNFSASGHYYWTYYVLANSFWVVIPMFIAVSCWKKITRAFSSEKTKKI
ncbi:probable 3-beta-hydroxysteroid-Delta(8),Delta(7)-isomerase [Cryptomeria japonica]|uniref:probable 3-beta-hydroxysteroid-Delta(8),Delta(7)-isomerase n=1 Tax=Cryptomeria japonica TaxID=3369 RepID=UPI0025ACCD5B|nr:probable 3-beta-hydroxysteroid-Delta(8),Delta(7)-isomerase [Cryptomeria japonica]